MSVFGSSEAEVIESLLPRYQAEGFDVYVNPSPSILPPFMQTYRPDAIALKKDKKIAIEVVGSTARSEQKIKTLQSLFADHDDWELRVFYASPIASNKLLGIASIPAINESIQRVIDLKEAGHLLPALVMAWATFEAVGRALLPEQFQRPQTPARLVEVLGSEGYVTPEEADTLRAASTIRNAVVAACGKFVTKYGAWRMAQGSAARVRRMGSVICPSGCFLNRVSIPLCKNISLHPSGKSSLQIRAIPPTRGAVRDRQERGEGCGGRGSVRRDTWWQGRSANGL